MDRPAKAELVVSLRQLVEDVPGVGQRPGESVQLGDNQCVGPAGGQGQPKPGPVSVGAGQAVVDVDAAVADAQRVQSVALGGEILVLCDTRAYPTGSSFIHLR